MELLISLVVASMVVSGLLYVVVELTTIDKREANLDQVQRDMNRAMDYIVDDLQEAVYVYPNPQFIANQLSLDSAFPNGAGNVPVLAFWRIDPVETNLPNCTVGSDSFKRACSLLEIRQAVYTLVVYVQKKNDGTNRNWPGQSRIIRYDLKMYRGSLADLKSTNPTLALRSGYRDPANSTDLLASFEGWQKGDGDPAGNSDVLVDYVQAPTFDTPVALNRPPLSDAGGACRGFGVVGSTPLYSIVPSTATTTVNNSFFACVRDPTVALAASRGNQDVYVFLRGNVQGVSGGVRGFSNEASLPILESQVLVKGVVNKSFSQ